MYIAQIRPHTCVMQHLRNSWTLNAINATTVSTEWREKWRRSCVAFLCNLDTVLFNHFCGRSSLCLHLHHHSHSYKRHHMNRLLKSNIYWSHAILFQNKMRHQGCTIPIWYKCDEIKSVNPGFATFNIRKKDHWFRQVSCVRHLCVSFFRFACEWIRRTKKKRCNVVAIFFNDNVNTNNCLEMKRMLLRRWPTSASIETKKQRGHSMACLWRGTNKRCTEAKRPICIQLFHYIDKLYWTVAKRIYFHIRRKKATAVIGVFSLKCFLCVAWQTVR